MTEDQRASAPVGVLLTSALTEPWAIRRGLHAILFRGRLRPGTAALPEMPLPGVERGISFGLSSAPVVLRSVGGSFSVRANTPWAVPSDGSWRLVVDQVTDLRLVHGDGAAVQAKAFGHRPIRFDGHERTIMRAAIKASTPLWVDARSEPITDLSRYGGTEPMSIAQPIGTLADHDISAAFLMMATWALEQRQEDEDQRLSRVIEYVGSRLADPGLSTASVATHCRLSRRTLQTLFASHGGLASYIRRQRLAEVLRLLASEQLPDLDAVAQATGLGSRRTGARHAQVLRADPVAGPGAPARRRRTARAHCPRPPS
jgi:AraC-like DNA-binding protein